MIPQIIVLILFTRIIWVKLKVFSYSEKTKSDFYNTLLGVILFATLLIWGGFFNPLYG